MSQIPNRELWMTNSDAAFAEALRRIKHTRHYESLDFRNLKALTNLPAEIGNDSVRSLSLFRLPISNINALRGAVALRSLSLYGTQVSDVSPLMNLGELRSLWLTGTNVKDIFALSFLTRLEVLVLDHTSVNDLRPLAELTKLRVLRITHTGVTDLIAIENLISLRQLSFSFTDVSDLGPVRNLQKLRSLSLHHTLVEDLSPLADLVSLVVAATQEQRPWPLASPRRVGEKIKQSIGLSFAACPIVDQFVKGLENAQNPERTIRVIDHIREKHNLPPIDMEKIQNKEIESDWRDKLSQLEQTRLGAQFVQRGSRLVIDPSGSDSDILATTEPVTCQLHEGVRRRAREFQNVAKRASNKYGWTALGDAAEYFARAVDRDTGDIPKVIGTVYEAIISLASYLELDARLHKAGESDALEPLDSDIQRVFIDLIRIAAPLVRRFPTARALDDEAGAFLSRPVDYGAAAAVVDVAESTNIIFEDDAYLLRMMVVAAERGGLQGRKAGARGVSSVKNLLSMLAIVLSFEAGMIGNEAAGTSALARRGAELYLKAEETILQLFEDASADLRQALLALIDDLRKNQGGVPGNLPERPRQRFMSVDGKTEEDDEGAG